MQQNGLVNSVSTMLGAGHLKHQLTDWKATFGTAAFISSLIIFCGEGLGQVCILTDTIKVCWYDLQCSCLLTDMFTGGFKGRGSRQAIDSPVS